MEFNFNKTYYKITNEKENHNGYRYHKGLNVDSNEWSTEACSAGGFYFTDIENIFEWLEYGDIIGYYVREITVPKDAKVYIESNYCGTTKYKANKIILGKRMKLQNVNTIKYLIEQGADIHTYEELALCWASMNGHLAIVKYLVELGADIHTYEELALCWASMNGHLAIVKYLVEQGADIHADNDYALRCASLKGHLDVVKYLVEQGADIHVDNDYALQMACKYGYLAIVKYLVEHGANIHANNDIALRLATIYNHLNVLKYLKSLKKSEKMRMPYNVITLCGSTRFKDEFMNVQKDLTLKGNIVISVGLFGHSGDNEVWENMDEGTVTKTKEMLDDMHKRKIDMSDEIFVIDVDGYIGKSTEEEIKYAEAHGKVISYYSKTYNK